MGKPAKETSERSEKTLRSKSLMTLKDNVKTISYFTLYTTFCGPLDWLLIIFYSLAAVANGLCLVAFCIIFGRTIDKLGPNSGLDKLVHQIITLSIVFVVVGGVTLIASYISVAGFMANAVRIGNRIRVRYLKAMLRQDVTFFDISTTAGGLLNSLNQDTATVQDGLGEKVAAFLQNTTTAVGGIIVAFVYSWDMTLVVLSAVPFMGASGAALASVIGWAETQGAAAHRDASAVSQECFGNIKAVSAFNAQSYMARKYARFLDKPKWFETKQQLAHSLAMGCTNLSFFGLFALALWYGGRKIARGEMTGGKVLTVLLSVIIAGFSIGLAMPAVQKFKQAGAAGSLLYMIIKRKPEIDELDPSGQQPETCEGHLELKNVSFSYPVRPDVMVFRNFSLDIPAGKSTALVGESGSGKSTIISLLLRFYDPLSGSITLDGVDLMDLNVRWLRTRVGLVSQEPTLFATSILENVRYGKPGATDEEVVDALKAANAWRFIKRLPDGVNTYVGEKGLHMSGGQKQRIAIARAIIKAPAVLLLDEATSALDAQSERVVQVALDSVMKGRTTVIVAHRLSTIRNADKIAVVRKGEVIEEGTHTMLTLRQGAYASLVRAQQGSIVGSAIMAITGGVSSAAAAVSAAKDEEDEVATGPGTSEELSTSEPSTEVKEKTKKRKEKVPYSRIWELNKREWPFLIIGVLSSGGVGALMPLFGFFFSRVISSFFVPLDEVEHKVCLWVILFAVVGGSSLILNILQGGSLGYMAANLAMRIRGVLFKAMLRQDQGWYDMPQHSTGNLAADLAKQAYYVKGALADNVSVVLQNLSALVIAYVLAMIASWKVALVITATFPFMVITATFQAKFAQGFDHDSSKRFSAANSTAADAVTNIKVIQAFSLVDDISKLYAHHMAGPTKDSVRSANVSGFGFSLGSGYMYFMWALGFWYGATLIHKGEIGFGQVMQALMVLVFAGQGLQQAQMSFPDLGKGAAAAINIFRTIDRVPPVDVDDESGEKPDRVVGHIQFRNVVFRYPARPTVEVFQGFTLDIPAGRTVALVGESGSGKSTAIALIQRWYDPESGTVLLDGRDVRQLCVRWMRSHMALVQQEPVLFTGTIAENIAFGEDEPSRDAVERAARLANAAKFIEALPEGYDTMIGSGGVQLSGGQKQRVAIARAVYRDPRILLLDEATSALDSESERVVQAALDSVMRGRTTVVVAHRLSTIRGADKIAVVQQGKVIEEGGHTALSLRGGTYANLIRAQAQA